MILAGTISRQASADCGKGDARELAGCELTGGVARQGMGGRSFPFAVLAVTYPRTARCSATISSMAWNTSIGRQSAGLR